MMVHKLVQNRCGTNRSDFWKSSPAHPIFTTQLRKTVNLKKKTEATDLQQSVHSVKSIGFVSHTRFGGYKNKPGAFSIFDGEKIQRLLS